MGRPASGRAAGPTAPASAWAVAWSYRSAAYSSTAPIPAGAPSSWCSATENDRSNFAEPPATSSTSESRPVRPRSPGVVALAVSITWKSGWRESERSRRERLDEPLERHVGVGERVEVGAPHPVEQLGQRRVAGGVGAQDEGVDEEARRARRGPRRRGLPRVCRAGRRRPPPCRVSRAARVACSNMNVLAS